MNPYLIHLISTYGYLVIFPLIVIEGPGTIFLSGFMISLGFLNPIITYIVIILADLFGDILYYSAGRWGLFKMSLKRYPNLKKIFAKHSGKIMFFGKLSSFIGGLVMYMAGLVKVSFLEFILINGLGAFFKTLLLLTAGYYLGSVLAKSGKSFDTISTIGLLLMSAFIFGLYLAITKFSNKYIKNTRV